jgi:hypothetical protein
MNDELRVEGHETRLCALPSSRKAGVRLGRRKAHLLAVALRRAGTVTARPFVGRRSKGDGGWIGVKTPSEGIMLRRRRTPSLKTGSKLPLSINPEPSTWTRAEGQPPGFRPGKAEGIDLKRENWLPDRHFGSFLGYPSRRTADLATERPKGLKNLYFIAWYGIYS